MIQKKEDSAEREGYTAKTASFQERVGLQARMTGFSEETNRILRGLPKIPRLTLALFRSFPTAISAKSTILPLQCPAVLNCELSTLQ